MKPGHRFNLGTTSGTAAGRGRRTSWRCLASGNVPPPPPVPLDDRTCCAAPPDSARCSDQPHYASNQEVEEVNYCEKLGDAFKGILVGIILVGAGLGVGGWNEYRNVVLVLSLPLTTKLPKGV